MSEFDYDKLGPKSQRMVDAAMDVLTDGEWHTWASVRRPMLAAGGLTKNWADSLRNPMVSAGIIENRGTSRARRVRLVQPHA